MMNQDREAGRNKWKKQLLQKESLFGPSKA